MRGDKPLSTMGFMFPQFKALATSQDLIEWRDFTEARLNSLLRDTDLSPCHVQQLLKRGGLDQTVHLQDTPNYALPVDLLEHIPS